MTRLIVIIAIVVAVIWLVRRAIAGPRVAKPPQEAGEQKGALVACAQCGVNLPQTEAYAASGVQPGADGRYYCSEEHWRLGPKDG